MKPNFILELSQDGLRLRAADGGQNAVLGDVSLSEPDFDAKVAALRNTVAEKSDAPLATELRIPDTEVLYTTLDDPEFDATTAKVSREAFRDSAVRDALDGMTPYALPDLNFIWKIKGKGELCIAAVAHETLAEAEQFAASRGFNPVRFVANPGKDKFKGIADFGPTAAQRARAAAQQAEEAAAKAAQEAAARKAAAQAAAEAAAQAATASVAPPTEPASAAVDIAPDDGAPKIDTSKGDSPANPVQTPGSQSGAAAKVADPAPTDDPKTAAKPIQQTAEPNKPTAQAAETTSASRSAMAPAAPKPTTSLASGKPLRPKGLVDPSAAADGEAPRVGFSQPRINDPLPPLDDSSVIDDVPAMPAISFASRRKISDGPVPPAPARTVGPLTPGIAADGGGKDSRLSRIAARFSVAPGADSLAKAAAPPPPPRRATTPGGALPGEKLPLRGSADKPGTATPRPGPARAAPEGILPDSSQAAASLTPDTGFAARPLAKSPRDGSVPRLPPPGPLNEAEAMTVFGARATTPGRSVTPLIVGLFLAVVLAIAVWAAVQFFSSDQVSGESGAILPNDETALILPETPPAPAETVVTAVTEPTDPAPSEARPSASMDVADLAIGDDVGEASSNQVSAPDSTVATLSPRAPESPSSEQPPLGQSAPPPLANDLLQRPPAGDANSENVVARYATTGVWVAPPVAPNAPQTDRVDGLYVASIDPAVAEPAAPVALGLSPLAAPDPLLPQLSPAPPGQIFDLDERGLVRATPEGALSPDGIVITAGPPPRQPPARPARPETLVPALGSQPDLPRTRPRDRPTDPSGDVAGDSDQTGLPTPQESRFAVLSPPARPPTISGLAKTDDAPTAQDQARDAAPAAAAASTVAPEAPLRSTPPRPAPASLAALRQAPNVVAPEAPAEASPVVEPVSPFAVARSRLPKSRPNNFGNLVAQARAQAPSVRSVPDQQVARAVAPAAAVVPTIPSRASVATQATLKNAINLGRINLIGVYGNTSSRSALVRLPSGKFVKVKVGDRMDGGRVAAIGQSQLSYVKGGRQVVLAIPQG